MHGNKYEMHMEDIATITILERLVANWDDLPAYEQDTLTSWWLSLTIEDVEALEYVAKHFDLTWNYTKHTEEKQVTSPYEDGVISLTPLR